MTNALQVAGGSSAFVAGVDGAPGGWAVVTTDINRSRVFVRKVGSLSEMLEDATDYAVIAIDVPIGLLDAYEIGGRACDRDARKLLGRPRGSSVFPAPVRSVLAATTWAEACVLSRASAPDGKAVAKQTYNIVDKIREVDELLQRQPDLHGVIREVHPEVCFRELTGKPLTHSKTSVVGRDERLSALPRFSPNFRE